MTGWLGCAGDGVRAVAGTLAHALVVQIVLTSAILASGRLQS